MAVRAPAFLLMMLTPEAEVPVSVLISDSFSRSGDLNGSSPDVATGTWVVPGSPPNSEPQMTNGVLNAHADSSNDKRMNLPFEFESGAVYELSVDVDVEDGSGTSWLGVGFTDDTAADASAGEGLYAWMHLRSDVSGSDDGRTFTGLNTAGGTAYSASTNAGTLKIVLDTSGTAWSAEFYYNDECVRTETLSVTPSLTGVFLASSSGVGGTFDNLLLLGSSDDVPSITILSDNGGARISPLIAGSNLKNNDCRGLLNTNTMLLNTNNIDSLVAPMNVSTYRFPGGAKASSYHWADAVGPVEERGGSTIAYLFGTAEYVEFCRYVGAEPIITVNWASGTTQEAAAWVEYCNGSTNTAMGALRAEHGYPDPFDVTWWEVGNETYYVTNVQAYAESFLDYVDAMKAVDADIQIGAVATQLENMKGAGDSVNWNETLFNQLGTAPDFYIQHYYAWLNYSIGLDEFDENAAFVAGMTSFGSERLLADVITAQEIFSDGDTEVPVFITEYNAHYGEAGMSPYLESTLNGVLVGGMLNTFIKCRIPEAAHWTAFTDGFSKFASVAMCSGYTPRLRGSARVIPMYEEYAKGRVIPCQVTCPLQTHQDHKIFEDGIITELEDAPVLDALATVSSNRLSLFVLNRSLLDLTGLDVDIVGLDVTGSPTIEVYRGDDAFGSSHEVIEVATNELDGLESCSITMLSWPIEQPEADTGGNTVLQKQWDFSTLDEIQFTTYVSTNDIIVYSTDGAQVAGEILNDCSCPGGTGALQLDIQQAPATAAQNKISISFRCFETLYPDTEYKVSFDVKTSQNSTFSAELLEDTSPWGRVGTSAQSVTAINTTAGSWQSVEMIVQPTSELSATRLPVLYLGALDTQTVHVANVKIEEVIREENDLQICGNFADESSLDYFSFYTSDGAVLDSSTDPDAEFPGGKGVLNVTLSTAPSSGSANSVQASCLSSNAVVSGDTYLISFWVRTTGDNVTDTDCFTAEVIQRTSPWAYIGDEDQCVQEIDCSARWEKVMLFVEATASFSDTRMPIFYLGSLPEGTTVSIADLRVVKVDGSLMSTLSW